MEFRWRCAESEGHRGRFSEQVCASRDPGVHTGMGKKLHIIRAPQHPRETPGKNSQNTGRQDEYNELAKDTEGGGSPDTRSTAEAKRKHEKTEW